MDSPSKKTADYRVLSVLVGLACILLGLLLGMSINTNSHNVLASYRSSDITMEKSNAMLSVLVKDECERMLEDNAAETVTVRKVEMLQNAHDSIILYLNHLRFDFICFVDGNNGGVLHSIDDVSNSTNFMINQGHAKELETRLKDYQEQLLHLIDNSQQRARVKADIDFHTEDEYTNGWVAHHFDHTMAIEVVNQLDLLSQQAHLTAYRVLREISKESAKRNSDNH